MKHEKVYLVTDGCMWEKNKREGASHAHAMEVVDIETGAVQYITSGSHIKFIEGQISDLRTQEAYNKATTPKRKKVSRKRQNSANGNGSEKSRPTDESASV